MQAEKLTKIPNLTIHKNKKNSYNIIPTVQVMQL